jgi:hypothetical protein
MCEVEDGEFHSVSVSGHRSAREQSARENILKNTALTLFAVTLSLLLAEFALRIEGRYQDLVSQVLVPSPAIWEPPVNQVEFRPHPDLDTPIEIRFDRDGVRNHSEPSTREKRNIIGFFGDSFVENRRIEDRFSFTSILDVAAHPGARVVNYGVDGYGLDQSYLRYKKYENHDIHDVVYVFCENDLRNLYETSLTEMTPDEEDIAFHVPRINPFYQLIGRFRITYLVISGYYKAHELVDFIKVGKWKWKSLRSEQLLPKTIVHALKINMSIRLQQTSCLLARHLRLCDCLKNLLYFSKNGNARSKRLIEPSVCSSCLDKSMMRSQRSSFVISTGTSSIRLTTSQIIKIGDFKLMVIGMSMGMRKWRN